LNSILWTYINFFQKHIKLLAVSGRIGPICLWRLLYYFSSTVHKTTALCHGCYDFRRSQEAKDSQVRYIVQLTIMLPV